MSITDPVPISLGLIHRPALDRDLRYGIELEYEGVILPRETLQYWTTTPDGSLRNNGVEFVSNILDRDTLPQALDTIEEFLLPLHPDANPRCGVHVHMNMRPQTVGQLFSFLVAYVLMEPSIFQHYCPERLTSSFCVPVYKNNDVIARAHAAVQSARRGDSRPLSNLVNTSKYSAMNVSSLARFGTVEARQFPATTDFRLLRRWITTLTRLYDVSVRYADPARVVAIYEGLGLTGFQDTFLNVRVTVPQEEQRQAYIAGSIMAGYNEPTWEDLSWDNITLEEL